MPKSWSDTFANIPPEDLAELLLDSKQNTKFVWPLSLLAVKLLLQKLSIPRAPVEFPCVSSTFLDKITLLLEKI